MMIIFFVWTVGKGYTIGGKWASHSANYTFDPSVPSSFYSAINAGALTWTNSVASTWKWINLSTPSNAVKHVSIDGAHNVLGQAIQAPSGTITGFEMKFDNAENWYTGTGTPGRMTRISPAQWNQDSGEYWDDTKESSGMLSFVISYIEVDVVQTIAVSITLEPQIKLPVLSEGYVVDENNNVIEEKERAHDLAAGDQAVFFIKPTDLAWRGGTRPVLYLMGYPGHSYFKLGEDGLYRGALLEGAFTLDELIKRIEEERAKPAQ